MSDVEERYCLETITRKCASSNQKGEWQKNEEQNDAYEDHEPSSSTKLNVSPIDIVHSQFLESAPRMNSATSVLNASGFSRLEMCPAPSISA